MRRTRGKPVKMHLPAAWRVAPSPSYLSPINSKLKKRARGARRAVFSPCVRRRSRRAMGTACPHPPRVELRQEATARADGPWSRLTPTVPRTNVRKGAATHPAGACCACIYTPRPMARRLRLLTHGLKNAHPLPRALSSSVVNSLLLLSGKTL